MDNYKEIITKLKKKNTHIAVIGDICLDHYSFVSNENTEISVETGLRTNSVKEYKYCLGGAGNVAYDLRQLGALVDLYGVCGKDEQAEVLKYILKNNGINADGIISQSQDWYTHEYNKIIDNNIEIARFDIGNFNKIKLETYKQMLEILKSKIESYDAIILNEQVLKGITTSQTIAELNNFIGDNPNKIWIADTRNFIGCFKGVIYKMNKDEALSALCDNKDTELFDIPKKYYEKFKYPIIITLGKEGALSFDGKELHHANGLDLNCEIDIVGAGDSLLSTLTYCYANNVRLSDSIEIGNYAATASVKKLFQTGNPTWEDVLLEMEDPLYRYNPTIASEVPIYMPGTLVESFSNKKITFPQIAIFDHDGTISTLRQGWEHVMLQTCMESIIGSNKISSDKRKEIENTVSAMIDKTTGIQTIIQMKYLVELIDKFNLIDKRNIKTASEYKKIYLEALKDSMRTKLESLEKEELNTFDFTIKDSVKFLHFLKDGGCKLYLASGTDQEDVIKEAEKLGYANLFEGRIFGSIGDIEGDAKKIVLQDIMKEVDLLNINHEECVVFGDGPVEMREAKKHNFIAVGLLSDEKQRFGVNLAKRQRQILAGADYLIPDFSQIKYIMEV